MKQDLFKNLPSDIMIDILSRLPVRAVISCKYVQKAWLSLLESREFVKSHLSKSVPGLIICEENYLSFGLHFYSIFEFEDGFNVEHHDLHYKLVTKFEHANFGKILGSADGLVFLVKPCELKNNPDALYICNPITRDYISLHCPPEFLDSYRQGVTYGFGSSKMSGQYKVVRISEAECYVYTLGTGSWRKHPSCALLENKCYSIVAFANGNLYWLVCDLDRCIRISCFDLETEHFSTLSTPLCWNLLDSFRLNLFVWGDCLGLCDTTSRDEIVIWLMKEYGVEESWTKEFVIPKLGGHLFFETSAYPIKVFEDGDILILWNGVCFVYYSAKTKTTQKVDLFMTPYVDAIHAMLYTPSFLSLKSFGLENVSSF